MLNEAIVHPTVSVVNLEEAKKFYGETLGLKLKEEETEGHLLFEAGKGSLITVYKRSELPKAENTAAGFFVDDMDKTVHLLQEKGVVFEEYDFPGLKTVNGIATLGERKAAWFKDPAGNILAISSY